MADADHARPVSFTEEEVPLEGIEESIDELVELYGGQMSEETGFRRSFVLPLRRGVAAGGGVHCTVDWKADGEGTAAVTLTCDRDVDAPRLQRILMLIVGVAGALTFTVWPFFPRGNDAGALAWIGGALAIAVYFLTLRKTSGGIAFDFFRRLVGRQREQAEEEP